VAEITSKDVVGKALGRRPHVDDSQELLSYRTALFGSVIGTVLAGVWLRATGLNLQSTVVFLLSALVIYIGVARIISQTGLAYSRAAVAAPVFTANALGSSALGPAGLSALGLSFAWAADLRTFVMASTATGLKMAREVGLEHRRLFWAVIAAIVVSLAGSMWVVLVLAYDHGGNNIGTWKFQGLPSYTGGWVLANIANPQPAQAWHLGSGSPFRPSRAWRKSSSTSVPALSFCRHCSICPLSSILPSSDSRANQ
jgi:hypothetical protein